MSFSIEHNGEIRSLKKSFKKSAIDFLSKFEDDIYTMILIFIWLISLKNDHVIDFFLYLGTCQCALSPCVVIFLKFCGRSTAQTLRKELNVHHFEVYFMRENNYYSVLNLFCMINISKLKYREGLLCNKGIELGQNVNDYNVELPILKFCYLIYVIKRWFTLSFDWHFYQM